jgi:hypothetical protein
MVLAILPGVMLGLTAGIKHVVAAVCDTKFT